MENRARKEIAQLGKCLLLSCKRRMQGLTLRCVVDYAMHDQMKYRNSIFVTTVTFHGHVEAFGGVESQNYDTEQATWFSRVIAFDSIVADHPLVSRVNVKLKCSSRK